MKNLFNFSLIETKYFWIAIVCIGTIGIWLPFLMGSDIKINEIPILFTTYYISIYFSGCLDNVINKIKDIKNVDENVDVIKRFLNIISLIILAIALVLATILLNQNQFHITAIVISLIGTFISLNLWWKNNKEEKTYDQQVREDVEENHGNNW